MSNVFIPSSIRDKAIRDTLIAIVRELTNSNEVEVQSNPPNYNDPGNQGDIVYATSDSSIWVFTGNAWTPSAIGQTSQTYFAYADTADGSGPTFSTTYYTGALYIGVSVTLYTPPASPTPSTNNADYSWARLKGEDGTTGTDAPRFAEIVLYTNAALSATPPAPSATITWSTGALSSITSGWTEDIPTVTANSTDSIYLSKLSFSDTSAPFTTTTVTGTTPVKTINFSGVVTFSGGDFNVDGSPITTIDGGNIETGTISADKIDTTQLVLNSSNILTIDGSQVATRSHRVILDDYIDDLAGVALSPGASANGTRVLGGNNTDVLKYRFSADIDNLSIYTPDDEFRTKRFYYPVVVSTGNHYSIDNKNVKFFTIEDINAAQNTSFYTNNNSNDFYRAGNNNNDRTVAFGISGSYMYLNMVEVLTEVNPAVEFNDPGRIKIEVQVTADNTNIPELTSITMESFAINIEEFFTVTASAAPGVDYTFTQIFEVIDNIQLTGTTGTTPYASFTSANITRVVGNGLVYGVARGY